MKNKLIYFLLMSLLVSTIKAQAEIINFSSPTQKTIFQSKIFFAKDTSIEIQKRSIRLLAGKMWILQTKKIIVETVYGSTVIEGRHSFVDLDLKKDQMLVRISLGRALIKNRKEEIFPVNFGEEMWVGLLDRNGEQTRGVPQPVLWATFVKQWGQDFPYKEEISAASKEIKMFKQDRAEVSAKISELVIDRKLAENKDKDEQDLKNKRKALTEKEKLRKQFFDRVFYR